MRIVIEVAPQFPKRGIGVYTENLIKGLAKIDKENEYVLFSWFFKNYEKKMKMLYCPEQENFSLLIKRFPDSLLSTFEWKLGLPVVYNFLRNKKIDIYHSPGPRLPQLNKVKKIITIHDLIHEIYPDWVNTEFIKVNREAIRHADIIIADSENTKNDLMKFYNLPENKIVVVYLGVDTDVFHPIDDKNELLKVKQKYSLPEKFILDVGPFEPRRNTESLFFAYEKIKEKIPDYKIVLVGEITKKLQQDIERLNLVDDVIFTSHISQDDLVCIYNLATVFVHPSFYEGFGLPILEAMACGCPVITSNVSSLPEVAGDGAILINPHSINDIADAILFVIFDSTFREQLKNKGLKRVEQFDWGKTAQKTLQLYKEVS